MSRLTHYKDNDPSNPISITEDPSEIEASLKAAGITYRQWATYDAATAISELEESDHRSEHILTFYKQEILRLKASEGYTTADVIRLTPEHPEKKSLREKFLNEHTHSEDEVRFFVEGQGLFTMHINNHVYSLLCEKGDLINVPANTPHWFDMGENPRFTCIRLFTNPEGWVAQYTDSDIAKQFPRLSE